MRILQVNKFATPTSGAENYFLRLTRKLAERGHKVALLTSGRIDNSVSDLTCFKADGLDFHAITGVIDRLRAAQNVWHSRTARDVMDLALAEFNPDIVHFHNIAHHLSHSVVEAAKKRGVGTLMTCHDFKLICPAYTALRNESPCFACSSTISPHCIGSRCLHDSLTWSMMAAAEAVKIRRSPSRTLPDALLCPSGFMANRLNQSWLQGETQIHLLRNPVEISGSTSVGTGGGIYVGRLSPEKGLHDAIEASRRSRVPLVFVGDGPERQSLETFATDADVQFRGFLTGDELEREWSRASFMVMPSRWPENAPLAALEALVRGKALVSTRVGGLPELHELIPDAGEEVEPGDIVGLGVAMQKVAAPGAPRPDVDTVLNVLGWPNHLRELETHYENCAA